MNIISRNKRMLFILSAMVFLLAIPLVAMLFTNEVHWSFFDFAVAAALLTATGIAAEAVVRNVKKSTYRIILFASIFIVVFLVWAELAVGIFGTAFAGS